MTYFLRTTDAHGRSRGGFQWPLEIGAVVSAPDWSPKPVCGGGLHGLRNGLGNASLLDWGSNALWWIVEADDDQAVDLRGKWKFASCRVIAFGTRADVTATLYALCPGPIHGVMLTGGEGSTLAGGDWSTLTGGHRATLTGGDWSTLTGGHRATLTGGHSAKLTGGHRATLTGGDCSTLTGGDGATLTGGEGSTLTGGHRATLTGGHSATLIFLRWIAGLSRVLVAYVGEDGIMPGVAYRANDDHSAVVPVDGGAA